MIPALAAALLHFLWQGALIAFALWIALALLRRSVPNARYAACAAALVLMTAAPAVTTYALYERPAPVRAAAALMLALTAAPITPASPPLDLRQWIVPVWAFGVAIFALRLAFAWRHVARLRRTANPVDSSLLECARALASRLGITRPVRLLVSALAEAPSVVGWLKPVILIPASALAGLEAAQLEAIITHELAHIRRHDYLFNLLQTVVETLLFYHPAVWWVSSRMRQERELCCDDLAVRHCGDALVYARALTRMERLRSAPSPAVAANGGSLLYRIERLTGAAHEAAPSRAPLVFALIALVVPLAPHGAAARMQPAAPAQPAQAAPSESQPTPPAQSGNTARGTVVLKATLDGNGIALDASVVEGPLALRAQALRWVLGRKFPKPNRGNDTITVSLVVGEKGIVEMRTMPHASMQQVDLEQSRRRLEELEVKLQTLRAGRNRPDNDSFDQQNGQLQRLQDLQAQLEVNGYSRNHPEIKSLEAQIASAQEQVAKQAQVMLTRQIEEQMLQRRRDELNAALLTQRSQLQDARDPEQIRAIKTQIAGIETDLAASMRGAKLLSIDRGPLASTIELPVKPGDTLTATTTEELTEAVRKSDPALELRFVDEGDNRVSIHIVRR